MLVYFPQYTFAPKLNPAVGSTLPFVVFFLFFSQSQSVAEDLVYGLSKM